MTNDEALTLLEESLRKLKIQYDLFFTGNRKLPPTEDRRRLDVLIHELAKARMRDNATRFRYNTLLGRYNQFRELWGRKMREREEGPLDYRRRVKALAEAGEPMEMPPPEKETRSRPPVTSELGDSYVKVTGETAAEAARRLHEQITAAQSELGKGGLSLDQVEQIVRTQSEMMRSRYSVDEVAFRVEIVEGKVKLKAKPLQKNS